MKPYNNERSPLVIKIQNARYRGSGVLEV